MFAIVLAMSVAGADAPKPRPPFPAGAQAVLTNGDRLAGTLIGGDDRAVELRLDSGSTIRIPLTMLDLLQIAPTSDRMPETADWIPADRRMDYAKLANGEILAGNLERFTAEGNVVLNQDDKPRTVAKSAIAAIAFNPALANRKPPAGEYFAVVARSGDRITARAMTATAETTEITTPYDAKIVLPNVSLVTAVKWSATSLPLTSLKPVKNETTPFGTLTWPMAVNRSAKNGPLKLRTDRGVEWFDRGLGTHPRTILEYKLDGQYKSFESIVGFDAETGRIGSAIVKVQLDGIEGKTGLPYPFTAADGVKTIRIEVTNKNVMTLLVDFAPGGDTQADLNWIEPRLNK